MDEKKSPEPMALLDGAGEPGRREAVEARRRPSRTRPSRARTHLGAPGAPRRMSRPARFPRPVSFTGPRSSAGSQAEAGPKAAPANPTRRSH
jgi:hypothetical protein